MKNGARKLRAFILCVYFLQVFAPTTDVLGAQASLPPEAAKTLETAIEAWNSIYGMKVHAKGWSYEMKISSLKDLGRVLENLTDRNQTWFPDIDISRPQEIRVSRLTDSDSTQRPFAVWRSDLAKIVKVGHHVARLTWLNGDHQFSTLAITNVSTVIYDSMLSNAIIVQQRKGSFELRIGWIWEKYYPPEKFTRGLITADVKPQCIRASPSACLPACYAVLQLGDAKINYKVVKTRDSCKLDFSWAFATSYLKKIKVGVDKFTLEVEGYLGSSGMGSNALVEKCPR